MAALGSNSFPGEMMTTLALDDVLDWLAEGAPTAQRSEDALAQLCQRMVRCGIPVSRSAVFVMTLHPQIMGRRFVWTDKGDSVAIHDAAFDVLASDDYHASPVYAVRRSRRPLRCSLTAPPAPDEYTVLRDLRAEGATDYVAHPLLFGDGSVHVATWATVAPGGFTDAQLAAIARIVPPLARVAEIRALRRNASNLLDVYVGHQAGERILAGEIRRGHVEEITAAIWLSDMRGFTARAERLPAQSLVDLLNRYFDCQVPAIAARGGEVLKFIGDGLLAIFPIAGGEDVRPVCERALAAATAADACIRALAVPVGDGEAVTFGVALHVGRVMYGNIGGGDRLDFTCIGPAVNLAARLEKVAARLDRSIVASGEFAAQLPGRFTPLGEVPVSGLSMLQPVFAPAVASSGS